jgi:hypothetical protein
MFSRCRLAFALVAGVSVTTLAGMPAAATDLYEPGTQPLAAPVGGWKFGLTPRVWFAWETDTFFIEDKRIQQTQETYFYPFYGGSATLTSPGGTAYSLTVLHGEGDTTVNGVQLLSQAGLIVPPLVALPNGDVPAARLFGSRFTTAVENERTDVEAIAQIPVAEGVTGTLGFRYINFRRDERFTGTIDYVSLRDLERGIDRLKSFAFDPTKFALEQDFWLGELGFGVKQPVNAKGTIQFFGNITGMFGYANVTEFKTPPNNTTALGVFSQEEGVFDGGVIGVDTNAGIAFALAQSLVLSARYRLFYLSAPDVKFDVGGQFIHGPEVQATFTF